MKGVAMRSWKAMSSRLRLAIAATVIVALAIAGAVATERFDRSKPTAAAPPRVDPVDRDDAKRAAKTLELGDVAKVSSNYSVAVTEISVYEGVKAEVVAATVKAEYIGNADGDPWADLIVEFEAPRGRVFGESECPEDLGDASDEPDMATGDVRTYVVCIEVVGTDVGDGKLAVEEAFVSGKRVFWSTDGAVAKTMPAAPVRRAPAASGRQPATSNNTSDNDDGTDDYCTDDHDEDIEEYRENIDDFDKLAEQADEDDQDDYEEWKDGMEEKIEQYEKVC